jgi:hypothetical protein
MEEPYPVAFFSMPACNQLKKKPQKLSGEGRTIPYTASTILNQITRLDQCVPSIFTRCPRSCLHEAFDGIP